MRLIVAGSRDFADYEKLRKHLDHFLRNTTEEIEIVSGRCDIGQPTFFAPNYIWVCGADGLGEQYAERSGLPVKTFPADWSLGKKAGPIRKQSNGRLRHSPCFILGRL